MSRDDSGLPRDRLWQPLTAKWLAATFGLALVYAVLRYHLADHVSWAHFPLFILNKATSLGALLLVSCSYLVGRVFKWHNHDPAMRLVVVKFCGLMGFFMAGIHAFLSLCLLRPAYLAKYFDDDGRLNLVGELGMTVGVLGLFALLGPALTTLPMMPKAIGGQRWKRGQHLGYLALTLVSIHLVALGLGGWLTPGKWPWGLPPISLLAAVAALSTLAVKWRSTRS